MKILNFGSCNIDYVYSVEHFVLPGETLCADKLNIFPGGKGLNQSVALANAGCEVYHAGCIGDDGAFLRELLISHSINTDFLKTAPSKTGHAIIEVIPDGENRIMIFAGANRDITESMVDCTFEHFCENDIIVLQNEISCRDYIIKKAKEKRLITVFNPAPFTSDITTEALNGISYLIVNKTEANSLTGESNVDDIIDIIRKKLPDCRVVLTLGKEGCCYFDSTQVIMQNAFSVNAVDTTAAGDTFIGYFVAGIAQNKSINDILRISCAASALCVQKLGASSSIPTISEVKGAMGNLKEIKHDAFYRSLIAYCENNLSNASLDGFAKQMNYSRSYTIRRTRAAINMCFTAYLQNLRCEKAEALIAETDKSISEIVLLCGYVNETHFRELFKKKYGCNPLEYRKKNKR